jgi:DNA-binding response OmpR family regulator
MNDASGRRAAADASEKCAATAARRVVIIAADRALFGLLREWLVDIGCVVLGEDGSGVAGHFDLAIVDVPFPRHGGTQLIARVAGNYPAVPILALSSCFFGDVECQGQVARSVGVQSVLPKPVARDRLVAAVTSLLGQQ